MSRERSAAPLDGILLIDKEAGWTSHDVVAKARGITRQRRIGHTGTLDPAATGLLVLCLGKATRLVEYMSGHDKAYEGEILLGVSTETDDAEGAVIARNEIPDITESDIDALAERFRGKQDQVPPAYSAVKVDGQRAYAVARKGGKLSLAARPVVIHDIALKKVDAARIALRVRCGAGTYVRSLARDIGAALGCGAHLASLRRTETGPFHVNDAVRIAELQTFVDEGQLCDLLRSADEGVMDLNAVVVANERGDFLANGRTLSVRTRPWEPADETRIYRIDGGFVGIGQVEPDGTIRPSKVIDIRPERA